MRDFAISFAKSSLRRGKVLYTERRAPLDGALELLPLFAAEEFRWRNMKRLLRLVSSTATAKFALYCSRNWIRRKSESAPEYFGISNIEIPVFDRRVMGTDRPSQEGREDVPSELSFSVSAPEADPMPIVTRPSEGTRPEPTQSWMRFVSSLLKKCVMLCVMCYVISGYISTPTSVCEHISPPPSDRTLQHYVRFGASGVVFHNTPCWH